MKLYTQSRKAVSRLTESIKTLLFGFILVLVIPSTYADEPGMTPINFAVNSSGSAGFSMPIAVPPGTAGMQPSLSINYTSGNGNGPMGQGWSLGGLSFISRCSQTKAQDNNIRSVKYDVEDKFCIDGQRMIAVTGNYGDVGTIYRKEIDDFSTIQSIGGTPGNPNGFLVHAKSGQIFQYGYSLDSRIKASSSTATVRVWAVNKILDRVGNYIDFSYRVDDDQQDFRLEKIEYTGNVNTGLDTYSRVEFEYEARPFQNFGYLNGFRYELRERLTNIKTYHGNDLVRDYVLNYVIDSSGLEKTLLSSIQECDNNSVCFQPTEFEYTPSGLGLFENAYQQQVVTNDHTNAKPNVGDFNGDGILDAATTNTSDTGIWVTVSLGNGDGTFETGIQNRISTTNDTDWTVFIADYNADGKSDIVALNPNDGGFWIKTALGNGNGSFGNVKVFQATTNDHSSAIPDLGDFNGDGYIDAVAKAATDGGLFVTVALGKGDGLFELGIQNQLSTNYYDNFQVSVGDYNTDGLADIVAMQAESDGVWITAALGNGDGTFGALKVSRPATNSHANSNIGIGDFNGDGVLDVSTLVTSDTGVWTTVCIGHGDGTFSTGIQNRLTTANYYEWQASVSDFNGDGLSDVVAMLTNEDGIWLTTALGKGNGTFQHARTTRTATNGHDNAIPISGDFNGDRLVDVIAINTNDTGVWLSASLVTGTAPYLLKNITDSLDNQTLIQYKPLTDSTVYSKDSGNNASSYPDKDIQAPFQVVATVDVSDGIGDYRRMNYRYGGAKVNLEGRGFLGFRWMRATDEETGIITETSHSQVFPYTGLILSTETYQPDGVTPLTRITNNYRHRVNNQGIYFPYVKTSYKRDYKLSNGAPIKTVQTHYGDYDGANGTDTAFNDTYDEFGNPLKITVLTRYGDFTDSSGQSIVITENDYTNDETRWILGRLTRTKVTKSNEEGDSAYRISDFTYYPSNGLLKQEIVEPTKAQFKKITEYTYDDYGNTVSTTVSGGLVSHKTFIEARTINTNFNADGNDSNHIPGQFPIYTRNAEEEIEYYTYNAKYGVMTSLTGPNNLTTEWRYDSFGRQVREIRADDTETTVHRTWNSSVDHAKVAEATYVSGSPTTLTISDSLGRVIMTRVQGRINSTTGNGDADIITRTKYNNKGQVLEQSLPYYEGSEAIWKSFQYDLLGRPKKITEPRLTGNVYVTYQYDGLTTTVTDRLNHSTTQIANARGELVEVIDADNNSTYYRYDPFGSQKEVEDALGNKTILNYNILGQKVSMIDPDMGQWIYVHNVLGQLVYQRDAKDQETTISYDKLDRMTKRTDEECTTYWVYGSDTNAHLSGPHAIGKLVYSQRGTDERIYTRYDDLGRPSEIRQELFDGSRVYVSKTEYDEYSRVKAITYPISHDYPTGLKVINHYDANGYLHYIGDTNSFIFWEALSQDALGNITDSRVANGNAITERIFDPYTGRVNSIKTTNVTTNAVVQKSGFSFDKEGNLAQRTGHSLQGLTAHETQLEILNTPIVENFYYDKLNRLDWSKVTGQATKDYSYDAIGNITFKSGVGQYNYGENAGPHAVTSTSVGNKTYSYDNNGNMLAGDGRTLTWASYNKPTEITKGNNYSRFIYGINRNRIRQQTEDKTTYYFASGFFEEEVEDDFTTFIHYIKAGEQTIAVVKSSDDTNNPLQTRYLHRDHIGSIESISDETGNLSEQLSFDPFGKRRNIDWSDTDPADDINPTTLVRGFTGHEHLDNVGIIHMNGRVYDANLGRFMSADPIVQFPENGQSYNRYSYVLNNPLSFTDPSGFGIFETLLDYFVGTLIGGPLLGVINAATGIVNDVLSNPIIGTVVQIAGCVFGQAAGCAATAAAVTHANGGSLGDIIKSAALSYATAEAYTAVGDAGVGGINKVVAHGVVGGLSSELGGGDFIAGFVSAGATAGFDVLGGYDAIGLGAAGATDIADYAYNAAVAATIGGVAAVLGGGKFQNGAISAAFSRLFNDLKHIKYKDRKIKNSREAENAEKNRQRSLDRKVIDGKVYAKNPNGDWYDLGRVYDVVSVDSDGHYYLTETKYRNKYFVATTRFLRHIQIVMALNTSRQFYFDLHVDEVVLTGKGIPNGSVTLSKGQYTINWTIVRENGNGVEVTTSNLEDMYEIATEIF